MKDNSKHKHKHDKDDQKAAALLPQAIATLQSPSSPSSSSITSSSGIFLPVTLGGLLLVVNVSYTIFIQVAANPDGSFPFYESSAVLVAEFGKLVLALFFLTRAYLQEKKAAAAAATDQPVPLPLASLRFTPTRQIVLEMAVPGLLYTISNILGYTTVGLLGSTNYQLFANLKVVVTAFAFRLIMQKRLKVIQWVCLFFLTAGLAVAATGNTTATTNQPIPKAQLVWGFLLMVVLSLASSLAGVFTELKLKQAPQHPMLQNALLYAWSCLICVAQYYGKRMAMGQTQGQEGSSFWQGFSWPLWGGILSTAVYGQVVALVFYYCDNMVKVFANSATVIASALVDQALFAKPLTIEIGIAGTMVGFSTLLYYGDHTILLQEDAHVWAKVASGIGSSCRSSSGPHSPRHPRRHSYYYRLTLLPPLLLSFWLMSYMQDMTSLTNNYNANNHNIADTNNIADNHNMPCDWPPPLYKPYPNHNQRVNMTGLATAMNTARRFFEQHPKSTFSYIDSGGALGVYRDGGLIPNDSDLDLRYGICKSCEYGKGGQTRARLKLPALSDAFISANNYALWGDPWTRRELPVASDAVHIRQVQRDLCVQEWAPGQYYWFHRSAMQRRAFQYTYGDFWFVRMPWKGVHNMNVWYEYVLASKGNRTAPDVFVKNWQRSLAEVHKMDTNGDGNVSVTELEQRVRDDGIIPERYQSQIGPREQCRAAAMLTFLLKFEAAPYSIPSQTVDNATCPLCAPSSGEHVLFDFPECEGRS